jgi:hypothetical protein
MADNFYKQKPTLDSVAQDGFAVTSNNTTVFSQPTRAVYVGVAGNIAVTMLGYNNSNTALTFVGVPAGTFLPIRVIQIKRTGTTANSILGLF